MFQAKLESLQVMASGDLVVVLDKIEEESLVDFQSGCVGSIFSVELKHLLLKLRQFISDKRQLTLSENSNLLKKQALDLRDACMEQVKVCSVQCENWSSKVQVLSATCSWLHLSAWDCMGLKPAAGKAGVCAAKAYEQHEAVA
jgi:hypothetical protein